MKTTTPPLISRQIKIIMLFSIVAGVGLFAVEFAVAVIPQVFLLLTGIVKTDQVSLPRWLVELPFEQAMAVFAAVVIARGMLVWAQTFLLGLTEELFRSNTRKALVSSVFKGKFGSVADSVAIFGELTNEAAISISFLQQSVLQGVSLVLIISAMFYMIPKLALMVVTAVAMIAFPMRGFFARIRTNARQTLHSFEHANRRVVTSLRNLLLIRIYGLEAREEAFCTARLNEVSRGLFHFWNYIAIVDSVPQTAGMLVVCCVLVIPADLNQLAPASLITFGYLSLRLLTQGSRLARALAEVLHRREILRKLQSWWVDHVQRVDSTIQEVLPAQDLPSSKTVCTPPAWVIENMSFQYVTGTRPVFVDLSLQIPPRTIVAITGPSGTGKSTLLQLLLGMVRPTRGEVFVEWEGRRFPISKIKHLLLPVVGYVGPEDFFVEGTVRENLKYGLLENPSDSAIQEALTLAECGFVDQLPGRLEYRVTDQSEGLSTGQKQRLALARALLRKPSVLILDEPTANVDFETERRLFDRLRLFKDKASILVVSHRPAILDFADRHIDLPLERLASPPQRQAG